jgi:seryl-tRNA synthetase
VLDIKFIRENLEIVKLAAKKKKSKVDLDRLLKIDDERRDIMTRLESRRAEQNQVSDKIPQAVGEDRERLIQNMQTLKADLQKDEELFKPILEEWQLLMLQVPNIPDMSVPEGAGEEDNVEVKTWGEKPKFNFEPKDHLDLMLQHKMVDFERGTKAHGFRGYFLINDGALLSWAIWNYARDFFLQKNFNPVIAPSILRKEHFYGTGHLPGDANDLFKTQDDDYLSGTAEVAMMAYHADEILRQDELPKRYLAFSPCFRREAGSHSKDVKGLIRVHEFFKWEQLIICEASHEESVKFHEELNRNTEEFIESLGIPYRQLEICSGDLKGAHVRSYDTELWVPKQKAYREIASASYYHDYQTRRFNTRYRDETGKIRYAHSLNATAIPTPRILVSLIENFQQADGSIKIPPVLHTYFGKDRIG